MEYLLWLFCRKTTALCTFYNTNLAYDTESFTWCHNCWKLFTKLIILLLTAARSSRSKWLSTRCFVTVFATPLECLPSNCRDSRLPSQRSSRGVMPRMKNSQTRQPGAQNPQPGPLPTGPCGRNKKVGMKRHKPIYTLMATKSLENIWLCFL